MDTLRQSLKSPGRQFQNRTSSSSPRRRNTSDDSPVEEELSILLDHRDEIVVKIDGDTTAAPTVAGPSSSPTPPSGGGIWREASYEFWPEKDAGDVSDFSFRSLHKTPPPPSPETKQQQDLAEDPPSRLIRRFIHKQRASGGEIPLDIDFEMEDLSSKISPAASTAPSPTVAASRDQRVSFQSEASASAPSSEEDELGPTAAAAPRRRSSARVSPSPKKGDADQVLRCTSISSDRRISTSTVLRARAGARSRLLDPVPAPDGRKSGRIPPRSGQFKSGMLGNKSSAGGDDDDEDPFHEDDLPDEYRRDTMGVLTVLQWASLVLILAALVCSLVVPVLQRRTIIGLHLWKWLVLVLAVICGRLVSGWCIRVAVFFIERNFLLRKRVLYFVYGVRRAVQNCLWFGLVLASWDSLFDKNVARETNGRALPYVTKVLFCLLVATLVRLVKTLLVKVLASSFHVSTYFDRIQEALFNQYLIEVLSGPPVIEIQHAMEEEELVVAEVRKFQNAGATLPNAFPAALRSGRVIGGGGGGGSSHGGMPRTPRVGKSGLFSSGSSKREAAIGGRQQPATEEDGITIEHLRKLNQKNISAWNMKRLVRIVRNGALSTLDERITHDDGGLEDDSAIRNEHEAKVAAKKIFVNVARPRSKYIYLEDFMRFLKDEEAVKAMHLFEGAQENKRVGKKSLKNWVVNAFRERRALSLTLNDTKTAVNKLHHMANVIVGIIVLGLWLIILGIATTHFFYILGSQVLLVVFMFGNTLKTIFESIIFLFVMHPFDVGDRCEVDGEQMLVEEMNIFTTIFLKGDNTKIIYPNTVLSTKPISNFYRSPDMGDAIDFCVHVSTPVQKLAIMKERIKGYIEGKKEMWYPSPTVVIKGVDDMNKLTVSIWMRHRMNYQDMGLRWTRRELVVQEMIKVLRELDVEYRMLPLDVNVRDMPAHASPRPPSIWSTSAT